MATYTGTTGDDIIGDDENTSGDDIIHDGGGGDDWIDAGPGSNVITVTGGNDMVFGGPGEDTLIVLWGDATTTVRFSDDGGDSLFDVARNRLVQFGSIQNFWITTGSGNDFLDLTTTVAGAGVAGAGDDVVNPGSGSDTVNTGAGRDRLIVDYSARAGALSFHVTQGDLATGYDGEWLEFQASRSSFSGVEVFTITGTRGEDYILTGDGDDLLDGRGGNDYLDGGAGDDVMKGGLGDDSYIIDSLGDVVVERVGGGVDAVVSSQSFNAQLRAQQVEFIILGGMAIEAVGNGLDNVIFGNDRDNLINGYKGADEMAGGLGNDTYIIDNSLDRVIEGAHQGIDTVRSTVAFTLGANLENLILIGDANVNGVGNGLANLMYGNAAVNTLNGGNGDDTLVGGLGVDVLLGGAGADVFVYRSGDDSAYGSYDRIRDFGAGDRIDLRDVDADMGTSGDQDFQIMSGFTGDGHQLVITYDEASNLTSILGDTDRNGRADFRIVLIGDHVDALSNGGVLGAYSVHHAVSDLPGG